MAVEINSFLKIATRNLGINENIYIVDNSNNITDLVDKTIDKFKIIPAFC